MSYAGAMACGAQFTFLPDAAESLNLSRDSCRRPAPLMGPLRHVMGAEIAVESGGTAIIIRSYLVLQATSIISGVPSQRCVVAQVFWTGSKQCLGEACFFRMSGDKG